MLADNRLAENAGWDAALLVSELEALTLDGFGISLASFSESDTDRLLRGTRGRDDEDEVPAASAQPVTAVGDVWCSAPIGWFAAIRLMPRPRSRPSLACGPRS